MACKSINNMYNKQQEQNNNNINTYTTPRISFSNGFAESKKSITTNNNFHNNDHHSHTAAAATSAAAAALDFEFSVPTFDVNSADELFWNGKLLPVVEDQKSLGGEGCFGPELDRKKVCTTTLRDELLVDDDDDDNDDDDCERGFRMRLPRLSKGSSTLGCKWKERFTSFRY